MSEENTQHIEKEVKRALEFLEELIGENDIESLNFQSPEDYTEDNLGRLLVTISYVITSRNGDLTTLSEESQKWWGVQVVLNMEKRIYRDSLFAEIKQKQEALEEYSKKTSEEISNAFTLAEKIRPFLFF